MKRRAISTSRDVVALVKRLQDEGVIVELILGGRGHAKAVLRNGHKVSIPGTPCASPRVVLNLEAQIRRAGMAAQDESLLDAGRVRAYTGSATKGDLK